MIKRLHSIESIRAFACIGVFLCHFKGAFFPNSITVAEIMKTPLNIVFSGNIPVRLMFIISGLVLAYKYFNLKEESKTILDIYKRIFRLGIPIFFTCLFAYILMRCNLMLNQVVAPITGSNDFLAVFNNFAPDFLLCIKDGIYGALFLNANAYVGPLWTMTYEMIGSIIVIIATSMLHDKFKSRVIFYFLFLMIFRNYYTYFVLGMLIADILVNADLQKLKSSKGQKVIFFLTIISMIYIGNPKWIDGNWKNFWIFSVACVVFFISFLNSNLLEKVLGEKNIILMWIGKRSYAIYLLHWPIIESFSCRCFLKLEWMNISREYVIFITLVLTIIVVLFSAEVFARTVELLAELVSAKVVSVISDDK